MEVYLISGLGADRRVFEKIDLPEHTLIHVDWIKPNNNESLANYARRLLPQLQSNRPVLVGVSFGGLVAIEIARHIDTHKVILISSARTFRAIPLLYRLAGSLGIHRIIPSFLLKQVNAFLFYFFGIKREKDKDLFQRIMKDTDDFFLRWAIDQIVKWRGDFELMNVHTIHGSKDRILPMKRCDYVIEGGGHFMIVDRADEITTALRKILNEP